MRRIIAITLVTALSLIGCNDSDNDTTAVDTDHPAATSTAVSSGDMTSWVDENGSLLVDLYTDMTTFSEAAGNFDLSGLQAACTLLQVHVDDAQSQPPMPDPDANEHWQAALADLGHAAPLCIEGADTANASLIEASTGYITSATGEISKTTDALG